MIGGSRLWMSIANVVAFVLDMYGWIVVIAVLLSWFPLDLSDSRTRTVIRFFRRATEPVFEFFRKTFQLNRLRFALDITPIVVLLAIRFVRIFAVVTLLDIPRMYTASQVAGYPLCNFLLAIADIFSSVLVFYLILVIIVWILFLIRMNTYNAIIQAIIYFLHAVTEPVFDFFRRTFRLRHYITSFDAGPLMTIISIFFLMIVVRYIKLGIFIIKGTF